LLKRLLQVAFGWDQKTERQKYLFNYRAAGLLAQALSILPIPLYRLLWGFDSDKHLPGWHSYGFSYTQVFRPLKYRPVKLLEIGIGGYRDSLGGRSLLAWQGYFPFGTIVAADIEPKQELAGLRRKIRQVDQFSAADLDTLTRQDGPFDIIIDDGSHRNSHQIFTFRHLFDALKNGGVYVIEDVETSFWYGTIKDVICEGARIDDTAFAGTCYGFFLELAKYLNHSEFPDLTGLDVEMLALAGQIKRIWFEHNMIFVFKGRNVEPSVFVRGRERDLAQLLPADAPVAQIAEAL